MPSTTPAETAVKSSSLPFQVIDPVEQLAIEALQAYQEATRLQSLITPQTPPQRVLSAPRIPTTVALSSPSGSEASTAILTPPPSTPKQRNAFETPSTPRTYPDRAKNKFRKRRSDEELRLGLTPCPGAVGIPSGAYMKKNQAEARGYLLGRKGWRQMKQKQKQSEGERWLRWKLGRKGRAEYNLVMEGDYLVLKLI